MKTDWPILDVLDNITELNLTIKTFGLIVKLIGSKGILILPVLGHNHYSWEQYAIAL
ncbi:MAG TPA: hypothetical protein VH415_06215 [Nitrososphaeraceae archaeon]